MLYIKDQEGGQEEDARAANEVGCQLSQLEGVRSIQRKFEIDLQCFVP